MARRIPPLNPLRVFEAVARTGNLTSAARQLHVTQPAVSRQIGVLEDYLEVELFRRERHGVTLTSAGRAYADQVLPAFERIAQATQDLIRCADADVLRVRTYSTFAAKWLIPRLGDFQRLHPDLQIKLSNAVEDVDFDEDRVEVAIQYGDGAWSQAHVDLLFHDQIEPVCTPAYLATHGAQASGRQALLGLRLLDSRYRRAEWADWLAAVGFADEASAAHRMVFGSSLLTWQAAMEGLGLAMGQTRLLTREFEAGQLVRPFARPVVRKQAYYLLRAKRQRPSRSVEAFRAWMLAECQTQDSGPDALAI
ncbi:MAG: transcriptional regulator GcvA [Burkholderiaceae bacterium]|nr:transcriptional regulator GcvA [Burkholderiaceae bacterium]